MSLFPLHDPAIRELVEKFGGWQRILAPEYSVPESLYEELNKAGYSKKQIDSIRSKNSKSEREAWVETIAKAFYFWWRASYQMLGGKKPSFWPGYPGIDEDVRWQDYPNPDNWQLYESVMTRFSIDKEEVDRYINAHPNIFKPLQDG